MKAFETTGKIKKNGQLLLNEPLDIDEDSEVKVIVLVSEKSEYDDRDDTPLEEIKAIVEKNLAKNPFAAVFLFFSFLDLMYISINHSKR